MVHHTSCIALRGCNVYQLVADVQLSNDVRPYLIWQQIPWWPTLYDAVYP